MNLSRFVVLASFSWRTRRELEIYRKETIERGSQEVTEYVLYTQGLDASALPSNQIITFTQEDSTLRQIREWIEQGWPSRLAGQQQQHLQPYLTRRHELVQGQCLQRPRLPENDLCRSQRHHFSHPESPSGPAKFQQGQKWLPGTVTATDGKRMVKVETPLGTQRRHVDQLRARLTPATPQSPVSTRATRVPEAVPILLRRSTQTRHPPERLGF
ncbi:hypothetical protein MRX96_042001 [Rhipicephalus microplus]